eukprot:TRINITY_DN36912_c0_g1_i1.p1 TRINITY_DN36912_c0_g1~~TRINITY_DN36912_c0_g1_i1.p1  ORF type:complete len:812 (-),score=132.11 TRINITY_DN36912_c0_g1_i1:78-2513(-)
MDAALMSSDALRTGSLSPVSATLRFRTVLGAELAALQLALTAACEEDIASAKQAEQQAQRQEFGILEQKLLQLQSENEELRSAIKVPEGCSKEFASASLASGSFMDFASGKAGASDPSFPAGMYSDSSSSSPASDKVLDEARDAATDCTGRSDFFFAPGDRERGCSGDRVAGKESEEATHVDQAEPSPVAAKGEAGVGIAPPKLLLAGPTPATALPKPKPSPRPGASKSFDGSTAGRSHTPSRIPKPRIPVGSASPADDLDDQQPNLSSKRRNSQTTPKRSSFGTPRSGTPTQQKSTTAARRASWDDSTIGRDTLKTRTMYDKRTLRLMNSEAFLRSIQEWRMKHSKVDSHTSLTASSFSCQVFVRIRPLFEKERRQGEFDAVTAFSGRGEIVIHNCLFQSDLIRMLIHHMGFRFPCVFGPDTENQLVYKECGLPLVEHALNGHLATLFMFGQTGSGKTYTMNAIIEPAVHDIFERQAEACCGEPPVTLHVFEVAGKKCLDLLSKTRSELKLLDDEDGQTKLVGATEVSTVSGSDLIAALRDGFSARATASHSRNDESSRSHCVCMMRLRDSGGCLVIVDCAGTERRQDTDQHSAERARETAEINTSLHALKECIRYRSMELRQVAGSSSREDARRDTPVRVPYRGSQLTRVLHESFTRPGSRLFVVGTLAPASIDTEHALSTLRTLQVLGKPLGTGAPDFEEKVDVDPVVNLTRASRRPPTKNLAGGESKPKTGSTTVTAASSKRAVAPRARVAPGAEAATPFPCSDADDAKRLQSSNAEDFLPSPACAADSLAKSEDAYSDDCFEVEED